MVVEPMSPTNTSFTDGFAVFFRGEPPLNDSISFIAVDDVQEFFAVEETSQIRTEDIDRRIKKCG